MSQNFGATPEDWLHFSKTLSLTADLLPVVSNPNTKISPLSKMTALGKTPSVVGSQGAAGIAGWTSKVSTEQDTTRWSANVDHGICLQTRNVRAIDVDVTDADLANLIYENIVLILGFVPPMRYRTDSSKFLLLVKCSGERVKEVVKTQHGAIELLADGQQCIIAGTHTGGKRYEWMGGLPTSIPEITCDQFDNLITQLRQQFETEPTTSERQKDSVTRNAKLHQAIENDLVAQHLLDEGLVKSTERDGRLHIICPFEAEHDSGAGAESSTTYFPAATGGYIQGHFDCKHAHCEGRTDADFLSEIGYSDDLGFENLNECVEEVKEILGVDRTDEKPIRFPFLTAEEFGSGEPLKWLVEDILPAADVGMCFGATMSGKSFQTLDMILDISRGVPYCGRKTLKTKVAYVVAEGARGFGSRLKAYAIANQVQLSELDFIGLKAAPDFMSKQDCIDIIAALKGSGVGLIIIDTFSTTFTGGESDSSAISAALSNYRKIGKALGGAMVLTIHHEGKVAANGARGSSAIKAGMDVELHVMRDENGMRSLGVSKQKDGSDEMEDIEFCLDNVLVGFGNDGKAVSSCTVDYGGL